MGPAGLVLDLDLVAEISAPVPVGLAARSYLLLLSLGPRSCRSHLRGRALFVAL